MNSLDWLYVVLISGIGIYILYKGLRLINKQKDTVYRSVYNSSDFTKQRRFKGKKQVYHKDDNIWLDWHTVTLLLIDSECDNSYEYFNSLEEDEKYIGTDYEVNDYIPPVTLSEVDSAESRVISSIVEDNSSSSSSYSSGSSDSYSSSSSYDSSSSSSSFD